MRAHDPRSIRENPCGKLFDSRLGAYWLYSLRFALDSTLNIGSIFKGRTELLLLLLTVRTPIGSVHFGLLRRQALVESVQPSITPMPSKIICGRECNKDYDRNQDVTRALRVRLLYPFALLLSFSTLL